MELKAYAYTMVSLVIGLAIFLHCADRSQTAAFGRRLLPLMLVAQAAAFMSPDVVIYNVIAGIALFAGCPDRRSIAPTYLFLLITLPTTNKIIAAGGTYIMSYDVTVSLGIAALIALAVRGKGSFPRSFLWDVPVYLLLILFVAANARATTATNVMRVTLEQGSLFLLPYFVVSRSIRSFDELRDALYGLAAGVAAMSTLAMYEAVHTWPLYRIVADHYGIVLSGDASVKVRAGFLRSPGPYTEPTSFGFVMAVGMLAAIGVPRLFASRTKRTIVLTIMSFGILAPQSRGAWIGLAVGMIAMHLYEGRYAALVKKLGIGAIGAMAVVAAAKVDTRIASTAGMNAEGQGTVEYRSNLLDRGIETVRAHPILGDTLANVRYAMRDMTQGEGIIDFVNTYLFVALVSGLVGMTVFVGSLAFPTVMMWQAKAAFARRQMQAFRQASSAPLVFATLLACIAMIASTSMIGRTTIVITVYIAFASAILNNMRAARRGFRQAPPDRGAVIARDLQPARA